MEGRDIKITGTAGYCTAFANTDKKFTGLEIIGNLAINSMHAIHARVNLGQQAVELGMIDIWILFVPFQIRRVPLQFLKRFGFQVGVAENFEYLEYASQRGATVPLGFPGQMVGGLFEQILKS